MLVVNNWNKISENATAASKFTIMLGTLSEVKNRLSIEGLKTRAIWDRYRPQK